MVAKTFFLKIVRDLVVILLILAGWLVPMSVSYGQTQEWSKPVILSLPGRFSWFPGITTDLAGGVHVFWATSRSVSNSSFGVYDAVAYCQPRLTGCADVVEVAALGGGGYNARPAAVVDGQGTIHMLWHGPNVIYYTSAPVMQHVSAQGWSSPRKLSGGASYYLNIAQDRRGVLHVVWSEGVDQSKSIICSGCGDIFYRQSDDQGRTWSAPVDLSNTELGSEKPQIAFGSDGTIYIAWEEGDEFLAGRGQPTSSMIIASRDGGRTWGQPTTFSFSGDAPQSIAVGVDAKDNVVVVWQQVVGNGIFYQVSTDHGQSWSPPKQMLGVVKGSFYDDLDDYDMAPDSAGHLHLVLVGRDPQTPSNLVDPPNSVYHLEWDGTTWSKPNPIFTAIGDVPEWPRIAVATGNQLHAVWFVRDKAHLWTGGSDEYKIWYAHGSSSAAATTPVAWPTLTPTPESKPIEATPPLTFNRAPTPTPALDPALAQLTTPSGLIDSIYTDSDEAILLAKSLIPAALIIAAVIAGVRLRRR